MKKFIFIIFCMTNIIILISWTHKAIAINMTPGTVLENIEALDPGEDLYDKNKYTKTESYTKTRLNDEEITYEKHVIECSKGGINSECSPKCETREVTLGVANEWKPCK